MSEAPERIWADQDNLTWVEAYPSEQMKSDEAEYTRSDLCVTRADLDAAVALALEAAAKAVEESEILHGGDTDELRPRSEGNRSGLAYAVAIRALIQPHQADALARVRLEAHNAAIEATRRVARDGSFPFDVEVWLTSTKKEMTAHVGLAIADAIAALALPVEAIENKPAES